MLSFAYGQYRQICVSSVSQACVWKYVLFKYESINVYMYIILILFYIYLHIWLPRFASKQSRRSVLGRSQATKKLPRILQENKVKTWPVRSLTLAWLHATAESTHFRIFISSLSSVFMMRCTVQSTHFRFETCRVVIPTSRRLSNGVLKTNYVQVRESWILIREAIRWHLQAKLIACPWKMEVERPSFLVWGNVAGASDFGSKGSIYCHRNLRAQKQCDTPPYWLGDWHRGQEDL